MNLIILTPDKEIFQGKVTSVNLPGLNGRFEVLDDHAPIVAALGTGEVRFKLAGGEQRAIAIQQGFVEVLRNEVSLLVTGIDSTQS
jgi:F-type H+-transporting ATPase subunit epsilon